MKLFKPQVQLFHKNILDEPNEYYLHAVTFCSRTNYRANGNNYVAEKVDENGVLQVELSIVQDPELLDFTSLTPVTHTIKLGKISPNDEEVLVNVQVLVDDLIKSRDGNSGSGSTVSSNDSEEDERPHGNW